MRYKTLIDPEAIQDIQRAIDYYDEQQPGLGRIFERTLNSTIKKLENNPFYQVRYDNVHCLPLKKFPYMIHFTIDEVQRFIIIRAVFGTHQSPEQWKNRG
jgi:toxin ParE1/3/4